MAGAKSFRMSSHGTDDKGNVVDVIIEIVRPDRQHTKMSMGAQSLETINIGSDVYTNLGGKWNKVASTAPSLPLAQFLNADELVGSFNDSVQRGDKLTLGGRDVIDGVPCQAFVSTPADLTEGGSTMWIGIADNLPRRLELTSAKAAVITFSEWNGAIKIEPPAI
jgi:hypothetical protein